jgi:hypothetical protein
LCGETGAIGQKFGRDPSPGELVVLGVGDLVVSALFVDALPQAQEVDVLVADPGFALQDSAAFASTCALRQGTQMHNLPALLVVLLQCLQKFLVFLRVFGGIPWFVWRHVCYLAFTRGLCDVWRETCTERVGCLAQWAIVLFVNARRASVAMMDEHQNATLPVLTSRADVGPSASSRELSGCDFPPKSGEPSLFHLTSTQSHDHCERRESHRSSSLSSSGAIDHSH